MYKAPYVEHSVEKNLNSKLYIMIIYALTIVFIC
jgi:hypothetical protein